MRTQSAQAVETLVLYCSSCCWMEHKQLQTARDSGLAKKPRDQQREEKGVKEMILW